MGKILFPILCSFFFLCDKVFLLFYLIAKKIANGTVDFTYNGMAQNEYGWWKITNGTVDFSFNGIASNQYGYWVIANGGVDFSYNGEYTYGAYTYNVVNGYAMSDHVHTWNPIYGYRQVDEYGEVPVSQQYFQIRDFNPLETCAARRTIKNAMQIITLHFLKYHLFMYLKFTDICNRI